MNKNAHLIDAVLLLSAALFILMALHVLSTQSFSQQFFAKQDSVRLASQLVPQGGHVSVLGLSKCEDVGAFLDLVSVPVSGSGSACAIPVSEAVDVGTHNLSMRVQGAEYVFQFVVSGKPCSPEGAVLGCAIDSCPGEKLCVNGFWSGCMVSGRVCVPGSVRNCPLETGCGSGTQACNSCGTAYSRCA